MRAQDDVSVYGLNYFTQSTDAFLGLPTDALGTDYRVMTYPGGLGQEMSVLATANDTVVTITPTVHALRTCARCALYPHRGHRRGPQPVGTLGRW